MEEQPSIEGSQIPQEPTEKPLDEVAAAIKTTSKKPFILVTFLFVLILFSGVLFLFSQQKISTSQKERTGFGALLAIPLNIFNRSSDVQDIEADQAENNLRTQTEAAQTPTPSTTEASAAQMEKDEKTLDRSLDEFEADLNETEKKLDDPAFNLGQ